MKKSRNLILENFVDEFSQNLANETFKLVKTWEKKKALDGNITSKFISNFVEMIVLDSLNKYKETKLLDEQEMYKFTKENFNVTKANVQMAVSTAFERAFNIYANRKVEYYCLVNLVPEPINDTVN